MMRSTLFAIATFAALGSMHRSADAGIITVNYSGSVSSFSGPGSVLQNMFGLGDTVSGSFSFDTSAAGIFTAFDGSFNQPLTTSFHADVAGDTFDRGSFYRIQVHDFPGFDRLEVLTFNPIQYTLPAGFRVSSMDIRFDDLTGTALSSLSMPTSINVGDWTSITLSIQVANTRTNTVDSELHATITTVNVVPEPAAMTLFGLGALGVAGAARRRRQNA